MQRAGLSVLGLSQHTVAAGGRRDRKGMEIRTHPQERELMEKEMGQELTNIDKQVVVEGRVSGCDVITHSLTHSPTA